MIDACLLGIGGMMPLPDRWLSALLLRTGGHTYLIDCGEGTQISWKRSGWSFNDTDAIILTHHHADHVAGLPGILFMLAHSDRTDPVTIYGPSGTRQLVDALSYIVPGLPFDLAICEIAEGDRVALPGGLELRALEVSHRVRCLAYSFTLERNREFLRAEAERLEIPVKYWKHLQQGVDVDIGGRTVEANQVLGPPRAGIKVSMVTDTRPTDEIPDFVRGSDLLVCEGMYGTDDQRERADERGHMVFSDAATIARDGGAKRLWLTHLSPALQAPEEYLDVARAIFPNTEIGQPHRTVTIPFPDNSNSPGM